MRTVKVLIVRTAVAWAALAAAPGARAAPTAAESDFFEKDVRPLLVARCYGCHSAASGKTKGGLALDTAAGLRKGGATGPALVPGDPNASALIKAVRRGDPDLEMPPDDDEKLSPQEVAILERWVRAGAPDPRTEVVTSAASGPLSSLAPLAKPAVPAPKTSWARTDVDRFLAAALDAKALRPVGDADRRTLIRRATFDLTGMPPTPAEITAFLADRAATPDAFTKVVDRLLASPRYGERWGRHWLDLVRYADTAGCNSDFPVAEAYKYRNWVIEAFNRDMPYDAFVREQVAGDLLAKGSDEATIIRRTTATGYLAISRRFGSRADENHLTIDDTIDNLGKTFLGLSIGCARCHDHKYDPISQRDYFALYGIFASTTYPFPGTEIFRFTKDFPMFGPAREVTRTKQQQDERWAYAQRIQELGQLLKTLRPAGKKKADAKAEVALAETGEPQPAARAITVSGVVKAPPAPLTGTAKAPPAPPTGTAKAPQGKPTGMATAPPATTRTAAEVKREINELRGQLEGFEFSEDGVERLYAVSEGTPTDARVHKKGDPKNLGDEVPRGYLAALGGYQVKGPGSGRLDLAAWLTDTRSGLLARVFVNRVWQHHFGAGLVGSGNDFGNRGAKPTHPELLDHLARGFVDGGWSVKALHRKLMLSRAYQLSSEAGGARAEKDPQNALRWRFPRRRLSAEEIRDAMLVISGTLKATPGGAHPFPHEQDRHYTQHTPFMASYPSAHRSVYVMQQRIQKLPFFEVFDAADASVATAQRQLSTTALQALTMMNDPLVHELSEMTAQRISVAHRTDEARIATLFGYAYGRPATAVEMSEGVQYLASNEAAMRRAGVAEEDRARRALASYVRMLFASNEFLYVD